MENEINSIKPVRLRKGKNYRLNRGYLWVFSNEISSDLKAYSPGEIVKVTRYDGRFLGVGYINPHSLVTVRLLSRSKIIPDKNYFHNKIISSDKKRKLFSINTVYRMVFSEGDFLPGLIVDKYDQYMVVQSTTVGMDRFIPGIIEVIQESFKPKAIIFRNDRITQENNNYVCRKDVVTGVYPGPIDVEVNGLVFRVDLLSGQKTGLYLDQIHHYPYLKNLVKGKSVLDCCCYNGGFAVHAAAYGAESVVGIDVSQNAVTFARINADLNKLGSKCLFIKGSLFDELRKLVSKSQKFHVVILDPPSFTRSKNRLKQAIKGYKELNIQAMKLLKNNGMLLTFSCSHHVSWEDFIHIVMMAAKDVKKSFQILHRFNQSHDHPSLLSMPETQYFKGLLLQQL